MMLVNSHVGAAVIRALACCGALAGAISAHAQTAQSAASSEESSADIGGLEEVLVTAQRRTERAQDVTVSLSVASAVELEKAGITNLRDLPAMVSGLNYTATGPFSQPNIRGVFTTFTQPGSDTPVGVYLDGLYQPNQSGTAFELPDVESIEVLKGPQGTLFGRNATGGAIVVHTLDPSFTPTGKVTVKDGVYFGDGEVSTANEVSVNGFVSGPVVGDVLAGSIAAYYRDNAGYLTNMRTGKRTGDQEAYLVRGKLLYEPTDALRLTLSGTYSDSEDHAANSMRVINNVSVGALFDDAVVPRPGNPWEVASELNDSVGTVKSKTKAGSLVVEFDVGDAGTLTATTGYTEVDTTFWQEVDGTYSPTCAATYVCLTPYVVFYGPSKTFQQELVFASEKRGRTSFVAGLLYYKDDHDYASSVAPTLDSNGNFPLSDRGIFWVDATAKTKAYAGFGEVTYDFTDRLTAIAGLRYSWEEKSARGSLFSAPFQDLGGSPDWDAWTPRLSLRYAISDDTNIYATYSEGFKSGVIESVSGTGDVADPEELRAYEVGVKTSTSRLSGSLAAFYYDYTDMQVQYFDELVTRISNAAKAEIYGLDLEGQFLVTDSLNLGISASWLPTAKFKEYDNAPADGFPMTPTGLTATVIDAAGVRLRGTPRFTGNVSLSYTSSTAWGELEASGLYHYSSEFTWEYLQRVKTKAYGTLAAQISLRPHGSGFKYSLWGRNLTNAEYLIGTTVSNQGDTGQYAAPRQMGISVEYSF